MKHFALSCFVALFLLSTVASAQLLPLTARDGFAAASAKAQSEFASDVYLANVFFAQITYNNVDVTLDMSTGQATGWLYRFYSPSRDSAVLYVAVKIMLLGVQALQPPTGTTVPIPPLPGVLQFAEPWIDSPAAVASAKTGPGGAAFLAAHPGANIDLMIAINNPIENPLVPKGKYWLVRFASGTENLTCAIDAESGVSVNCGQMTDVAAASAPRAFDIGYVHPNPCSLSMHAGASVEVTYAARRSVRIAVLDVLGREVAELLDAVMGPGPVSVRIDPSIFDGPGVYMLVAEGGGPAQLRTLLVTR
jgi:hypothetical protein